MRSALFGVVLAASAVLTIFACSSSDGDADAARVGGQNNNGFAAASGDGNAGSGPKTGGNSGGAPAIDLPGDGGTSSGGALGLGGNDACVSDSAIGEQLPVDLYMMIDKSGSMRCKPNEETSRRCVANTPPEESRWTAMQTALKGFIAAPDNAGNGVGLSFFPIIDTHLNLGCTETCDKTDRSCECYEKCGCQSCGCDWFFGCSCNDLEDVEMKCDVADYEPPVVPVGVLPTVAGELSSKIDAQWPGGSTPTVPALSGALKHATEWGKAHTDRRAALVFATDGEPDGCSWDNNIQNAAAVAKDAFAADPSISTYVIGIGPSLDNLNAIAEAGGTEKAYLLGTSGNAVEEFTKALQSIRGRALSCDYTIPEKSNLDYQKVNVNVTVGASGTSKIVGQAANKEACGDSEGWYYDDPAKPELISLCKKSCDEILAAPGSKLEVLMGCTTVVTGPK